jgi:hypothetical protein
MNKAAKRKLDKKLKRKRADLIQEMRRLHIASMCNGRTFPNIFSILDILITLHECPVRK